MEWKHRNNNAFTLAEETEFKWIHSHVYLFDQHELATFYVPGTFLNIEDKEMNNVFWKICHQ